MAEFPFTEAQVTAAAKQLLKEGEFYKWWPPQTLGDMDPIGKEEFLSVVERILAVAVSDAPVYTPANGSTVPEHYREFLRSMLKDEGTLPSEQSALE